MPSSCHKQLSGLVVLYATHPNNTQMDLWWSSPWNEPMSSWDTLVLTQHIARWFISYTYTTHTRTPLTLEGVVLCYPLWDGPQPLSQGAPKCNPFRCRTSSTITETTYIRQWATLFFVTYMYMWNYIYYIIYIHTHTYTHLCTRKFIIISADPLWSTGIKPMQIWYTYWGIL